MLIVESNPKEKDIIHLLEEDERQQISKLFNRDIKTIGKHINNALNEELKNIPTVAKFATKTVKTLDFSSVFVDFFTVI